MNKKKVVLITGASSFVGCHLVRRFSKNYTTIASGSQPLKEYVGIQKKRLEYCLEAAKYVKMNLENDDDINRVISAHRPSFIIHHAGFATNYSSNTFDFEKALSVNFYPLRKIFEQAKRSMVEKILVTGSSSEYGNFDAAIKEEEPCIPETKYGLAKLNATIEAINLSKEFAIPTAVLRLFIPYGPLDNPKKLIPSFIYSCKTNTPMMLTPCQQKRDFLSVSEVANAYFQVSKELTLSKSGIYNVCSGSPTRLRSLISLIEKKMGGGEIAQFGEKQMRAFESAINFGNNEKIQSTFDFKINSNLEFGIESYLESNDLP